MTTFFTFFICICIDTINKKYLDIDCDVFSLFFQSILDHIDHRFSFYFIDDFALLIQREFITKKRHHIIFLCDFRSRFFLFDNSLYDVCSENASLKIVANEQIAAHDFFI
jgi:hypothetical protein